MPEAAAFVVAAIIIGLLSGAAVTLLADWVPLRAWGIFFASAAIGVWASIAITGVVEILPVLLQSSSTWGFVAGSIAVPAFRLWRGNVVSNNALEADREA